MPTPLLQKRPIPNPALERQIAVLRKFYDDGKNSLRRDGRKMEYGSLQATGTSLSQQETLRKARAFAARYSRPDLDSLVTLCRREGFVLSTTHIVRLLSVEDKAERNQLQKMAIQNRWSKDQLNVEIRRRFGNRRRGAGRRPLQLNSAAEINPRIAQIAMKWLRFRQEMDRLAGKEPVQLSRKFKEHLAAADKALNALAKMINRPFESDGHN